MKTCIRTALCLGILLNVAAFSAAQEKVPTTITIRVPEKGQEETVLKVNGKKIDGDGETRVYKTTVEKGKTATFKIEILVEPNNYTKITRRKEITLKGGENDNVKLDMTADQTFEEVSRPDDIVVRFVPTPGDIVDEMAKLAKMKKDDVVYDLGCGDAIMLIRPVQQGKAKKGVGVEYDPEVMKLAIDNVKKAKLEDKITIRKGDMLKLKPSDVEDASVVLLYIGDDLGRRVSPVLKNTLKPGSRIVSHRFLLGDWKADKSITVKGEDGGEYELHLWIVPERKLEKQKDK